MMKNIIDKETSVKFRLNRLGAMREKSGYHRAWHCVFGCAYSIEESSSSGLEESRSYGARLQNRIREYMSGVQLSQE